MTTNEEAVALLNAALTHGGSGAMRERALHDAAIAARSALLAAAPDHQAEAPSDAALIDRARRTADSLDRSFPQDPVIEELDEGDDFTTGDLRALAALAARPVVDDAAVERGLASWFESATHAGAYETVAEHVKERNRPRMRAALVAALRTEGGEQ